MSITFFGTRLLRTARAVALGLALVVGIGAAGCTRPDAQGRARPDADGAEHDAATLLELVLVAPSRDEQAGPETRVQWTGRALVRTDDGAAVPMPRETSENDGLFAYAERRTPLLLEPRAEADSVGHLDPGARVGVREIKGAWARVALFAWRAADADVPLEAWARVADLGARARRTAPRLRSPEEGALRVAAREELHTAHGRVIGRTFCGEVDVIRREADAQRIAQSEDGVTVEGLVDPARVGRSAECPPVVLLDKKVFTLEDGGVSARTERLLRYHGRSRRHRGPTPAALEPTRAFTGPTFGDLARRGASVYWLVPDTEKIAICSRWTISRGERSNEGKLVARTRLEDGDTIVTTIGLHWSDEEQSVVTLLGPSSEVLGPPGREAKRRGGLATCGRTLRVVASEASALSLLAGEGAHGSNGRERVIAYERGATERWYADETSCEADARRARTAGRARGPIRGGC